MDSFSSATAELRLEAYGVRVLVMAKHPAHRRALEKLREDFAYFARRKGAEAGPDHHDVRFEFREGVAATGGPVIFSTRMCSVRGMGRTRICDYGGGLVISARNSSAGSGRDHREFVLSDLAPDANEPLAYETAYTTLLSAIGESLDLLGYHRVHALAFERNGEGWLIVLPSGGGKSTVCARLLNDPEVRILSDEMPLIRGGVAYPFPVRIALKPEDARVLLPAGAGRLFERRLFAPKMLFPIPSDRVAGPVRISRVVIGRPRLVRWFASVVVGLGLAQMAEHMLRPDSPLRLPGIALRRLVAAIRLAPLVLSPLPVEDARWLRPLFRPATEPAR